MKRTLFTKTDVGTLYQFIRKKSPRHIDPKIPSHGDHPKLSWYQFIYISDRLANPIASSFKLIQNVIRNLFWFADMTWNQANQEKVVESFRGCPTVLWVQSSVKASPICFFTSRISAQLFFGTVKLRQFLKYIFWVVVSSMFYFQPYLGK